MRCADGSSGRCARSAFATVEAGAPARDGLVGQPSPAEPDGELLVHARASVLRGVTAPEVPRTGIGAHRGEQPGDRGRPFAASLSRGVR